jgi:hypothetical protein
MDNLRVNPKPKPTRDSQSRVWIQRAGAEKLSFDPVPAVVQSCQLPGLAAVRRSVQRRGPGGRGTNHESGRDRHVNYKYSSRRRDQGKQLGGHRTKWTARRRRTSSATATNSYSGRGGTLILPLQATTSPRRTSDSCRSSKDANVALSARVVPSSASLKTNKVQHGKESGSCTHARGCACGTAGVCGSSGTGPGNRRQICVPSIMNCPDNLFTSLAISLYH